MNKAWTSPYCSLFPSWIHFCVPLSYWNLQVHDSDEADPVSWQKGELRRQCKVSFGFIFGELMNRNLTLNLSLEVQNESKWYITSGFVPQVSYGTWNPITSDPLEVVHMDKRKSNPQDNKPTAFKAVFNTWISMGCTTLPGMEQASRKFRNSSHFWYVEIKWNQIKPIIPIRC